MVEHGREAGLPTPVEARRDVRHSAHVLDLTTDGTVIVALVAVKDASSGHLAQQDCSSGTISDLSAGQYGYDQISSKSQWNLYAKVRAKMSNRAEIERFKHVELGTALPTAKWDFALDLGANPERTWERILEVVEDIVAEDAASWPDDDYWRSALPIWLLSFLMTAEECDAAMVRTPREQWSQLPWEFGSWLDAIRERD